MIYDRLIEIATPESADSPLERRLRVRSRHYCTELSVYRDTYLQWAQTGETVERMVQLPRFGEIDATMYAIANDRVHRILRAQPTTDADGRDVYVLTLKREETRYDVWRA